MSEYTADHMTTQQLIAYLKAHTKSAATMAVIEVLERRMRVMMTPLPEAAERAFVENLTNQIRHDEEAVKL